MHPTAIEYIKMQLHAHMQGMYMVILYLFNSFLWDFRCTGEGHKYSTHVVSAIL